MCPFDHLCEMKEEVLDRSGLSSVWSNRKCDPLFRRKDDNSEMRIYDFMTLPSWGDAKVVKEPHHLPAPLLDRVSQHTTATTDEGALIPLPTSDEVVVAQPNPLLARSNSEVEQIEGLGDADISNFWVKLEDTRTPPFSSAVAVSEPSQIGTSVCAATPVRGVARKDARRCLDPLDTLARSALSHDAKYDQILEDDFATSSGGEEIDLTFFPLAPGPYVIPYPFKGDSSPLYTKQQWD
ncbi:hypothetical protein Tco_1137130 [Tanacetum coccineum]